MNLSIKPKQSYRCRKYGYQGVRRDRRQINWKIKIDTYTLLYIKQITIKDLPYNTEKSTQYSVMAYMAIESKKEWLYVFV